MVKPSTVLHYASHPNQLRAIVQWYVQITLFLYPFYCAASFSPEFIPEPLLTRISDTCRKVWHNPLHEREPEKETVSLRRCFQFLDLTSRSFSAVIQELCPELCVSVALFYLILRGLDTIEDDMTIALVEKEPLLRSFDEILDQEGWTYNGNGPNEKDRQLCVEFDVVIKEFAVLPENHRIIIKDITKKMGNGMADYANNAEHNVNGVNTVADYDLYCHYVAGLVGEGLTRLFVASEKANKALLDRPHLSNAMGMFLQKTNIIRDYAEDLADGRRFWPKEIWSKYITTYSDFPRPENKDAALNCISDMCLNALGHADECLFYLAGIKEQSVFNFAAIPQVMAIATLALVFRNEEVYHKNVKIAKGEACELMLEVGNLRTVAAVFRKYLKVIHKKNTPKDPNFLKISAACGKVYFTLTTLTRHVWLNVTYRLSNLLNLFSPLPRPPKKLQPAGNSTPPARRQKKRQWPKKRSSS